MYELGYPLNTSDCQKHVNHHVSHERERKKPPVIPQEPFTTWNLSVFDLPSLYLSVLYEGFCRWDSWESQARM